MFADFQRGILKIAEKNTRKGFQKPLSQIFLSTFVDAARRSLITEYGDEWATFFTEADEDLDFTAINNAVREVIKAEFLRLEARAEFTAIERHEVDCVIPNPVVHTIADAVVPFLAEEAHENQAAAEEAAAQDTEAA